MERIYHPRTIVIIRWVVLAALMSAALMLAASCGGPDGTYQGGDDDAPYWR